jgi:hypothetical protein
VAGELSGEARIVMDFDHEAVGFKARAAVEAQRVGMIEVAGVNPEAGDRLLPGFGHRDVHQGTA